MGMEKLGLAIGLNTDKGGDNTSGNEFPEQTVPIDSPEDPPVPDVVIRYCGVEDCEIKSGECTLKEHTEKYQVGLLYLDWYEKAEDYNKFLYTLKETGDAVCFQEFFMDSDANYIYIYVTDNRTEIDF